MGPKTICEYLDYINLPQHDPHNSVHGTGWSRSNVLDLYPVRISASSSAILKLFVIFLSCQSNSGTVSLLRHDNFLPDPFELINLHWSYRSTLRIISILKPSLNNSRNKQEIKCRTADHSGRTIWGMNRLYSLKHRDRRFESHSRHGCFCEFILCFIALCVGNDLATAWSPVQGVLQTMYSV
jgi:hypothetical protein